RRVVRRLPGEPRGAPRPHQRAAGRVRAAERLSENIAIAIDTLRVSKLRSGLTILGVVIGVATVMAMAAIVQGVRQQIVHTIEIAGPTTFYVTRSKNPVNPGNPPPEIRDRPEIKPAEADRVRQLPGIAYAGIWGQAQARMSYQGTRTQNVAIFCADNRFTEIQGGDLSEGRWFTRPELASGSAVAVIEQDMARTLFGRVDPLGKSTGAIVPFAMLDHQLPFDRTNALWIVVKPQPNVTVADAEEAVMVALRRMRHLRPAEPNSFDLLTQDQILDTFNKLTGVFFLVMIVLSAVALLVGGIGVMAIMMVSVTDRTREIGVRKALGATRLDILLQFLVEASTLTGIGGLVGILFGLGF